MAGLSFEILVDDTLAGISSASQLTGLVKKRVLSLINDFEDAEWRYPKFQSYMEKVCAKLHVRTRIEAVALAVAEGLLSSSWKGEGAGQELL